MKKNITSESISKSPQPISYGLALSGGGARGFAHAGALKAIDEAGIRIDVISGVSAGAVVAVLYAAGIKPDRILEMFVNGRFLDFAEFTFGKGGFLSIQRFTDFVTRALGKCQRLEDLRIPTYIGVTNFDKGTPEVFSSGEIGPIITASCSIPIAINPVIINSTTYVDGGVLRNLPAAPIREKCDRLIGINVSPLSPQKSKEHSLLSIALRAYSLLAKANQNADKKLCDILVSMDEVSDHKVFSLKEISVVFDSGYQKMKECLIDCGLWSQPAAPPD